MKMSLQVNRTLQGKSFGLYFAQKLERDDDLRVDQYYYPCCLGLSQFKTFIFLSVMRTNKQMSRLWMRRQLKKNDFVLLSSILLS